MASRKNQARWRDDQESPAIPRKQGVNESGFSCWFDTVVAHLYGELYRVPRFSEGRGFIDMDPSKCVPVARGVRVDVGMLVFGSDQG